VSEPKAQPDTPASSPGGDAARAAGDPDANGARPRGPAQEKAATPRPGETAPPPNRTAARSADARASDLGAATGAAAAGARGTLRRHDRNVEMLTRLDAFLDERAEEHRKAMEEVVSWLWKTGDLEAEIHRSVTSLGAIFQKWSFEILFLLRMRGKMRFNQLKEELTSVGREGLRGKVKDLAGVGSRTLSQRLKDLESQGLIERQAYAEVPVRVEYRLTPKGSRFGDLIMPVIAHLRIWDDQHPG
jgi:DNA-binding HxlR family transcriptional regulator